MTETPVTASQIREGFSQLAEKLRRRDVQGEIYIFGGAALVLAYDARVTTKDVDAAFMPHGPVQEEAVAVARDLNLPMHWLNEQGTVYLSRSYREGAVPVFDHSHLRVLTVSAHHLLAMKALAARRWADLDDIAFLTAHLGLDSVDQVAEVVSDVFPDEPLTKKARLVIADALAKH